MKFGNYNITTTPKERSRKFDIFRFSKIKSTTNHFVDRFQSKIETFRRLKSRSESPLSFRASLFERDGVGLFPRPIYEKFSPKDFPKSHFRGDNFYVFNTGNTIRKLSDNQKTISGKNNNYLNENFYCTLRTTIDEAPSSETATIINTPPPRTKHRHRLVNHSHDPNQHHIGHSNNTHNNNNSSSTSTSVTITPAPTIHRKHKNNPHVSTGPIESACNGKNRFMNEKHFGQPARSHHYRDQYKQRNFDAIDQCSSGIGSYVEKDYVNINNGTLRRRRYTNSLKDMLDSVSCLDEDTEFKVLKDYFETNSYSDIVKDTAFTDYLNKKNYNDILDYLNDGCVGNYSNLSIYTHDDTMGLLKQQTPIDEELLTSFYENETDHNKLYKWKSTGNLYESLSSYNNIEAINPGRIGTGASTNTITNNNHSYNRYKNGTINCNHDNGGSSWMAGMSHHNHGHAHAHPHPLPRPHNAMDVYSRTVDRLETSTYRRQRKPATYIGSTTSLNRRTNSKILQRQRERNREQDWKYHHSVAAPVMPPHSKFNFIPRLVGRNPEIRRSTSDNAFTSTLQSTQNHHYEDVKRFCDLFLNEHYTFNNNKWNKFDTSTLAKRYNERQYKKLINKFVKSKGYTTTDEYVQTKFGTILDRSIPKTSTMKSEKLDLPKTYIDNVQRRYHVTKQHFLAAERMRNDSR